MTRCNTDSEYEQAAAAEMCRYAFEHEVESYGIADGMRRRPADGSYVHRLEYLAGYSKGLALPAEPDHDGAT